MNTTTAQPMTTEELKARTAALIYTRIQFGTTKEQTMTTTQSIVDYATEHGVNPADLVAIIASDPDPVESAPVAHPARIETPEGTYEDAAYPVEYLQFCAEGIQ